MSNFTRIELKMAEFGRFRVETGEFTIMLTEFSLCSSVTMGLRQLDVV